MTCRTLSSIAGATVAAALAAAPAFAAEAYTLNGEAVSAAKARDAASCAAIADARGEVACFTSQRRLIRAQIAAIRRGAVPPGWGTVPTDVSADTLIDRLNAEADAGGPAATTARASRRRVIARAASAGSQCYGYTNIHIWADAGPSGDTGNIGPTGGWYTLSSTWTNRISSYRNSNYYRTWFADYSGGGGASYGPIATCWYNTNLDSATMSDGGTANDRFSSAWVGN